MGQGVNLFLRLFTLVVFVVTPILAMLFTIGALVGIGLVTIILALFRR